MRLKKVLLSFLFVFFTFCTAFCGILTTDVAPVFAEEPASVKTFGEIGNPTIAGTGAYYDDGMLKYANSGNTIGYTFDQSSSVLEFDIIFDYIKFPGWFSLTFKANGFDRTQSANLTQKGYSIIVYPTGTVEVRKPGLQTPITGTISGFATGVKYRFKVGVYNDNGAARVYFTVDNNVVLDAKDTVDPYLTGDWFNICGEGGTSARLYSTKKEIVPNYYTYTLSTLGDYPTCTATGASFDRYKNITLHGGTVGWNQGLKNYSVEMNMRWSNFGNGANVWVTMRSSGFERANSPNLETKGYVVRIARAGSIELFKNGVKCVRGSWKYVQDVDYVFEFGCVDLDENRTMVFVYVNGVAAVTMVDEQEPISKAGYFILNGDGVVDCQITSVSTKLTPLMTKVQETDAAYVVETYFHNTLSHTNMQYADFSSVLLDAILLNGTSVNDINNGYYAKAEDEKTRAVEVEYVNNKLVVTVAKQMYKKANDGLSAFTFEELALKKTGTDTGLVCPSGYVLKQTYYYSAK